jgi:hypothetical protein
MRESVVEPPTGRAKTKDPSSCFQTIRDKERVSARLDKRKMWQVSKGWKNEADRTHLARSHIRQVVVHIAPSLDIDNRQPLLPPILQDLEPHLKVVDLLQLPFWILRGRLDAWPKDSDDGGRGVLDRVHQPFAFFKLGRACEGVGLVGATEDG